MLTDRQKLTALRKLLKDNFNLEELKILCFDLDLNYEDLAGSTITAKIQDLIVHFQRRGNLQTLIDEVTIQRPKIDWPKFGESDRPSGDNYTDEKTSLEMIRIPAGEFIYGEDNEEAKTTTRLIYLDEYWIAKTPVTNKHYGRFIKTTRYKAPKHWEGNAPPVAIANHAVTHVSWHDAIAYCKWAGMQLPTEEQWEKAARGKDGRKYPWGNKWNFLTHWPGMSSSTSVGKNSPQTDSPYGCVDMVSNVWEWCLDIVYEGSKSKGKFQNENLNNISKIKFIMRGGLKIGKSKMPQSILDKFQGRWLLVGENLIMWTGYITLCRFTLPFMNTATEGFRVVKSSETIN